MSPETGSRGRPESHIALLRGINVGGKNKLPMKELARVFADLGCDGVRTYIQSGNVLFRAGDLVARRVAARVTEEIMLRFELRVPVITRSVAELASVVRSNPLLRAGKDPDKLGVAFLADRPAAAAVRALDARRSPPDEFVVRGREIYRYLPRGAARTKLTNAYFDARLRTISTVRNWRTTLKLLEMVSEMARG